MALPARGEITAFIKTHLAPWIEKIVRSPDTLVVLNFDQEGVSFQASYHPHGEGFSPGGYCSYTTIYSTEHNPMARRLVKKAGQLYHSAYRDLPAGIVLCDGGSELLAERGGCGGPTSCNLAQVIGHFFDVPEHGNVSFVVILSPQTIIHAWGLRTELVMSAKAFSNPRAVRRVEGDTLNGFTRLLARKPTSAGERCAERTSSTRQTRRLSRRWPTGRGLSFSGLKPLPVCLPSGCGSSCYKRGSLSRSERISNTI